MLARLVLGTLYPHKPYARVPTPTPASIIGPIGLLQVLLAGFVVGTLFLQIDVTLDGTSQFLGVCFSSGDCLLRFMFVACLLQWLCHRGRLTRSWARLLRVR